MTDKDYKSLCSYFDRVIRDAFESEKRQIKKDKQYYIFVIENGVIHFIVKTPFERVTRKAIYRLRENLNKNFGLIADNGTSCDDNHRFLHKDDGSVSVNFACNKYKTCIGNFYLDDMMNDLVEKQGNVIPSYRYEKLIEAYYDIDEDEYRRRTDRYDDLRTQGKKEECYCHIPSSISWKDYRKLYRKAFGDYPEIVVDWVSPGVEMIIE